jgi:uncharacterized membrane protein YhiD involved in acid resistance
MFLATLLGMFVIGMYAIVMTALFVSTRGKTNAMLQELDRTTTKGVVEYVRELNDKLSAVQRQLTITKKESEAAVRLRKEHADLSKQNRDLQQQFNAHTADSQTKQTKATRKETAYRQQVEWLQATTRRESKRAVLERYG